MIKLLFFGDVFGKAGRKVLSHVLPELVDDLKPDIIVANGENLADGKGLTERTAKPLFNLGVNVLTGGNHLWDRADSWEYIQKTPSIVKPLNYPEATPGASSYTISINDCKLVLLTACGQIYMPPCDSPFNVIERWIRNHADANTLIVVDFHAESTAEKRALGWFLDGKVTAVLGTHTHVQTADEEILPLGTAYITDVGMTGPHDSVIGVKKHIIVDKFKNSLPVRYESSDKGLQANAVFLEIDDQKRRTTSIQRIRKMVTVSEESMEKDDMA